MARSSREQVANKYINIITSIAGVVARQEPGVASVSCEPGSVIGTIIPKASKSGKSIRVDIVGNNAVIDISVNAKFGYKIPELVYSLQEHMRAEIEKATYYKVKTINVTIVGVVFSE